MIFNEALSVKEVNCVTFVTDWIGLIGNQGFSKKWRKWLPENSE